MAVGGIRIYRRREEGMSLARVEDVRRVGLRGKGDRDAQLVSVGGLVAHRDENGILRSVAVDIDARGNVGLYLAEVIALGKGSRRGGIGELGEQAVHAAYGAELPAGKEQMTFLGNKVSVFVVPPEEFDVLVRSRDRPDLVFAVHESGRCDHEPAAVRGKVDHKGLAVLVIERAMDFGMGRELEPFDIARRNAYIAYRVDIDHAVTVERGAVRNHSRFDLGIHDPNLLELLKADELERSGELVHGRIERDLRRFAGGLVPIDAVVVALIMPCRGIVDVEFSAVIRIAYLADRRSEFGYLRSEERGEREIIMLVIPVRDEHIIIGRFGDLRGFRGLRRDLFRLSGILRSGRRSGSRVRGNADVYAAARGKCDCEGKNDCQ